MRRGGSWAAILTATVLIVLAACSTERASPEARVRALIQDSAVAAEKKEIGTLKGAVSQRYGDAEGRDKRAIEGILRYHLLRHQAIHLFTRTHSVTFPQPGQALATVYVAMAGQPIADAQALARLRADFYRFEFLWAEEDGAWRVARAEWRPAELADFL